MSAHKPPSSSLEKVRILANSFLKNNWFIDDAFYNLSELGWKFEFNRAKKALGNCQLNSKTIFASRYIIDSNPEIEIWEDTIKHEIAHAIDFEMRGTSDHSVLWERVATQVGCIPQRTHVGGVLKINSSKYILKCDNCGFEKLAHRKRARSIACLPCCNKHNHGLYTDRFKLEVVKNY